MDEKEIEMSVNVFTRIEERFKKEVYHIGNDKFQIRAHEYNGGGLCLQVLQNGEPYARLTVKIADLPIHEFYVDTNNWPESVRFIQQFDIGRWTGAYKTSGFCQYPLYKLDRRFTQV